MLCAMLVLDIMAFMIRCLVEGDQEKVMWLLDSWITLVFISLPVYLKSHSDHV